MKAPLLVVMAMAAIAAAAAQRQRSTIDQVRWLVGCWEAKDARRTVREQWTLPVAQSMIGISRTVRNDTLVNYEMVLLRETPTGLAYEAHPSGQRAATFLEASRSDSSVTFENPRHDFPQRIGYERAGTDSLRAWISGSSAKGNRRITFSYRRAACE